MYVPISIVHEEDCNFISLDISDPRSVPSCVVGENTRAWQTYFYSLRSVVRVTYCYCFLGKN